jgi:molybdate transport system ATP-binding protein
MLALDIKKRLGNTQIAVAFTSPGRVTALFGPSGAGKTSILNMIAGLITPDDGQIRFDDHVLFDARTKTNVPVHRRQIGYVFQDSRLFPHLNVRHNLGYGRFMSRRRRNAEVERRVVDLLDIGALLERHVLALSGGETQRIAIGRALLSEPKLLLLDEPLSSLDDERKAEILPYLIRLRDEALMPMVYVSHVMQEVERLADCVIPIRGTSRTL